MYAFFYDGIWTSDLTLAEAWSRFKTAAVPSRWSPFRVAIARLDGNDTIVVERDAATDR